MISVQQSGADEAGADDQDGIVFLAVKAKQRHQSDQQRQDSGNDFHDRMKLSRALPTGAARNDEQGEKPDCGGEIDNLTGAVGRICSCRRLGNVAVCNGVGWHFRQPSVLF